MKSSPPQLASGSADLAPQNIKAPSPYVSTGNLNQQFILPRYLVRISSHKTREPFFGKSGTHRFDAPDKKLFGTCYLGKTLDVAIAESILHDAIPENGEFKVAPEEFENRYVIRFSGYKLKVADLTGAALKKVGGTADLSGTSNYRITQQWSQAVFQNPGNYDGFMYMSRHLNDRVAIVLFDKAGPKISMKSATKIIDCDGFAAAATKLGIIGA